MRSAVVLLVLLVCAVPTTARAQGNSSVVGFGGLTFGSSDLGRTATSASVGGTVTGALTPNIHIVGEGGRLSDIKPPLYELLEFTPVGFRLSAWYAQGGVRLIASPHRIVRPYTEATAGLARLHAGLSGLGSRADALVGAALGFVSRTEPVFGLGGGVVLGGGPLAVDVGYRYKHVAASGLASALNAGKAYHVNEARIGVGVRF